MNGQVKCLARNKILSAIWWKTNSNKLALIALETQTFSPLIKKISFSLSIVKTPQIKKLNQKYRNLNKSTDVLSFPGFDNFELPLPEIELGDIIICLDKLKEQAVEYNHSLEREAAFLFVHGFLHLLGYDHQNIKQENEMFELQATILNKAGFPR